MITECRFPVKCASVLKISQYMMTVYQKTCGLLFVTESVG